MSIPIFEKITILKHSYNQNLKPKFPQFLHLYSSFATPISILIPLLMGITLNENTLQNNPLLKFIFFLIPLSQLILLNFRLYQNVYSFSYKSTSKFSTSYLILKPRILLFAIISFLSIFAFPIPETNHIQTSSLFSLFLLSATPFFFISFSLTPNSSLFQDSAIDILALFIIPFFEGNHILFFLYFFFTLFKSQRIEHPSPKSIDTTLSRQILSSSSSSLPSFIYSSHFSHYP
ncbi:DUF2463 domain-containing protein [Encephalitozoon intestinalis]|nr:DUF2463 domain-containing protein [Encephalitozoon intestinalis]UTX44643.1 DUF2463 domain-containing protein [Encephalitozoon intestinalis]UTX44808.1 DUF2463 domain-containing protein [Encephalitozoon intestinalis]UTX44973.1 DUF2463 domain-containing protein [Encephalitozoon intestinalis]UTX45155.1 DUF2463 domain-containing protein [Encephalitozoon intestinalis]